MNNASGHAPSKPIDVQYKPMHPDRAIREKKVMNLATGRTNERWTGYS